MAQDRDQCVASSCGDSNEPVGAIKGGEILG
jgi:hypothetical protein